MEVTPSSSHNRNPSTATTTEACSIITNGSTMDSSCSAETNGTPFRFNWTIKNFKTIYDLKTTIDSPMFAVSVEGGDIMEMFLRIRPSLKCPAEQMALDLRNCTATSQCIQFNCAIIDCRGNKGYQGEWSDDFDVIESDGVFGWPEFISWKDLIDESKGLLLNNTLEIICDGCVINRALPLDSTESMKLRKTIRFTQLDKDFSNLLETGRFSDVTLVAEKKEFKAHQNILACRSPVFSAMFEHDMKEKQNCRVEIDDVEAAVLKQLLKFIYTENVEDFDKLDEKLLAAADKYGIDDLKGNCEKEIGSKLSIRNVVRILILADQHSANELKTESMTFICRNSKKLSKTDAWKAMGKAHPELMTEAFEAMANIYGEEEMQVELE